MGRRAFGAMVGLLGLGIAGFLVFQTGLWVDIVGAGPYEEGTVTVQNGTATEAATPCDRSPNATEVVACDESRQLATVTVRISDTLTQRRTGLSNTESLGPDEGMLFVHDEEETHSYVMRDMSFSLDIIFIDATGTITTIHHADPPPEGESYSEQYSGRGKYVLEVNRGWANRTGVSVGDTVELPDGVE